VGVEVGPRVDARPAFDDRDPRRARCAASVPPAAPDPTITTSKLVSCMRVDPSPAPGGAFDLAGMLIEMRPRVQRRAPQRSAHAGAAPAAPPRRRLAALAEPQ
jgi:hypothetical protein